jgi:hypothetical protein
METNMERPSTNQVNLRRIAIINTILFFFFWLLILLAGADFPPPPGFLFLVVVIAACALVVYWRVPTYIDWARARRPRHLGRLLLEGFAAGLVVAAPFFLNRSGQLSVTPQLVDYAIWFTIVGLMGALNSTAIYAINTLIIRIVDLVKKS